MNTKKHILITGISGVVGSLLVDNLSDDFIITGIDKVKRNDNNGVFLVDMSDMGALKNVFSQIGKVDYVIHLAANPSADAAWKDIFKDNFITTKNIYECAREFNVGRVIFAGSTHMFGGYSGYPKTSPFQRPISINDPPMPDSDYGDSKAYGELLARRYYDNYKIETLTLRIGQVTADDKPSEPYSPLWISHRDLSQVFRKALNSLIPFGAYFVMSNNKNLMFDLRPAIKDLNFLPLDPVN